MDKVLEKMIADSGAMWADARDRTTSPVLVATRGATYELTLPAGEGHPYWRVEPRDLTSDEKGALRIARARFGGHIGDLIGMNGDPEETEGPYMRVRAYVFNGRRANDWDISVERVRARIEPV